jgi:hypothetical protein
LACAKAGNANASSAKRVRKKRRMGGSLPNG